MSEHIPTQFGIDLDEFHSLDDEQKLASLEIYADRRGSSLEG